VIDLKSRSRFLRASARFVLPALAGSAAALAGTPERPRPAAWCESRCADLILDWNLTAHQVISADNGYQNPLPATRALAMMHLAMHDAVNAATPRFAPYALRERDSGADPAVAAVSAAHEVLLALYPSQKALLQAALSKSSWSRRWCRGRAGQVAGRRAAAAILVGGPMMGATRMSAMPRDEGRRVPLCPRHRFHRDGALAQGAAVRTAQP
jgi:hypothetical protein